MLDSHKKNVLVATKSCYALDIYVDVNECNMNLEGFVIIEKNRNNQTCAKSFRKPHVKITSGKPSEPMIPAVCVWPLC